MNTFIGLMIPFLGTTLGSACVFFLKKRAEAPSFKRHCLALPPVLWWQPLCGRC